MAEYLLDTRWACGWVKTDIDGIVIECAPIFKKLIGCNIEELRGYYKAYELKEQEETK